MKKSDKQTITDSLRDLMIKYPKWVYVFHKNKHYRFEDILLEVEKNSDVGKLFVNACLYK